MSGYERADFRQHQFVPVSKCSIDSDYQRERNAPFLNARKGKFDPNLFDPIAVSKRVGRGGHITYAVIDGQHRLELARQEGIEEVPALVYEGLSRTDESKLFRDFQRQRRGMKPFDDFRASLFGGEQWAVESDAVAREYGFTIGPFPQGGQDTVISGIRVIQRLYEDSFTEDGERAYNVLEGTLRHISEAWDAETAFRTDAQVIEGLGAFLLTYHEKYDAARLHGVLTPGEFTPGGLLPEVIRSRAYTERVRTASRRGAAGDGSAGRRASVMAVIVAAYNKSVRTDTVHDGRTGHVLRKPPVRKRRHVKTAA